MVLLEKYQYCSSNQLENIIFITAKKTVNYLRINKEMSYPNLYRENCKTLLQEMTKDIVV